MLVKNILLDIINKLSEDSMGNQKQFSNSLIQVRL